MTQTVRAPIDREGERLDTYLSLVDSGLTRSAVQRLIETGGVRVNGAPVRKNYRLHGGETIEVTYSDPTPVSVCAQEIPLDIVFEDADLVVVNKPRGMVVHPAAGNPDGTLVNALLYHCGESLSGINGEIRPGIVHRIDKDTSGLLVVAKNDRAHQGLAGQIKAHTARREYYALVVGHVKERNGTIDRPIGRHPTDRKKMAVTEKNARSAVTHYEVLKWYQGYTLVKCVLETGRTHQIRVHMASIGHPVAGDPVYGPKSDPLKLNGQCLHAKALSFTHPLNGEAMRFETELPSYFADVLEKLKEWES